MIVISKTIGRLIAAAVLTVTASTSAVSETVEISYQSLGTSTTLDLPHHKSDLFLQVLLK